MFQIHAVTSNQLSESIEALSERIIALLPFVDFVQIREKSRSPKEIAKLLDLVLKVSDSTKLIINDRADIAAAFGLSRVHLTESSLPIDRLQQAFPNLYFGRSFHSEAQIIEALPMYDYGYIGHVFPTQLKTYPPFGLAKLQTLKTLQPKGRLIAIGGINEQNIIEVAPYVDGVAVMSGFFNQSIEDSILHAKKLGELVWKLQ